MSSTNNSKTAIVLLIIVLILIGTNSYFWVRTSNLSSQLSSLQAQKAPAVTPVNSPAVSAAATLTPNASLTPSTTTTQTATSNSDAPSNATTTYVVKKGETLYPIGLKLNISWELLARVNGLADPNKLREGDVLVIPTVDDKTKKVTVSFMVAQDKAKTWQTKVDGGANPERKNPVETTRLDMPPLFGITNTTKMGLSDSTPDTVKVLVSATGGDLIVTLTQPVTKGDQGIWAITEIQER